MSDLGDYVQRTAGLAWCWGRQDCTMWVADWCVLRWGIDPASRYRGLYSDAEGALSVISSGLLATVSSEVSLRRKPVPDEGDVGVITVAGQQVAAIWSGEHWLFRKPGGFGATRRDALAIWGD